MSGMIKWLAEGFEWLQCTRKFQISCTHYTVHKIISETVSHILDIEFKNLARSMTMCSNSVPINGRALLSTMWAQPTLLTWRLHVCSLRQATCKERIWTSCNIRFLSPKVLTRPVQGPLCQGRPASGRCAGTPSSAALGNPSPVSGTVQWLDRQVPERTCHLAPPETLPGTLGLLVDPHSGMCLLTNPTRTIYISVHRTVSQA